MRNLIIIFILLIVSETAFALDSDNPRQPFIDKEFEKAEIIISDTINKCMKKTKKVSEKFKCGEDVREQFEKEGKLRGTEEYCRLHYKHFDYKGLVNFRYKLIKQKKTARFDPGIGKRLNGEVTKTKFKIEIGWIDIRLIEMRKQITKQRHEEVWNKGKKAK